MVAVPESHEILTPVSWRHCTFRDSGILLAKPKIVTTEVVGNDLRVTLSTASFAHAVHLDVPDDLRVSDHYFDMLPGEERTITVYNGAPLESLNVSVIS